MTPNIADIIRHHVALEVRCIDRMYLHAYMPKLQTSGGLCYFMRDHLGHPIPSPALFKPMHDRFRAAVHAFIARQAIPVVKFEAGQDKDAIANAHRARFPKREGVVLLGIAQEKQRSFKAQKRRGPQGGVTFDFSRQWVAPTQYYFYLQAREWGSAFVKIGTYLPYPVKLCLNGHEWVKQQLRHQPIRFESLETGFSRAPTPAPCRRPATRWGRPTSRPSRALVPAAALAADGDGPRRGLRPSPRPHSTGSQSQPGLPSACATPPFLEAVIRENLDLGRPDRVGLLFPLRITRTTPPPRYGYRTRVITDGVQPSLHVDYKHSHVKQYFKEQHALRTETTINNPRDFYVNKGLENLPHLRELGHQVNRKLLEVERVSHQCVLTQDALDRLQEPSLETGQRVSALRFGDPRVMAILQAITGFLHLLRGFHNRDLRPHVEALLGPVLLRPNDL
jgi:hypothetical protein